MHATAGSCFPRRYFADCRVNRRAGRVSSAELKPIQIAGRALVDGFARMQLDGHFPRWGVPEGEVERMAEAVLDVFSAGIAKPRRTE